MVVDLVLDTLIALLRGLLALLPSWDLGLGDVSGFGAIAGQTARVFQNWFPLATLVQCLGVLLAARVGLALWNLALWVYHQFWGSGGGS